MLRQGCSVQPVRLHCLFWQAVRGSFLPGSVQFGAGFRGDCKARLPAQAAGRVSPRQARHFSLFRQRKVPQRKADSLPVTPARAARRGNLWCSRPAGSCSNSRFASAQTVASPFPLAAALLGTGTEDGRWKSHAQTARKPDSQKPEVRPAQPARHTAPHQQMDVVVQPGQAARCILACPRWPQKR